MDAERMQCVFCSIIDGTARAAVVYQDDNIVAFLDATPLFPGHVLVVPRQHTELLWELPPEHAASFFIAVQRIALATKVAMEAQGIFVANNNQVSQSVAHMHVHVVPRTKGDGLKGFFWPRTKYESTEHMEQVAARIRTQL